MSLDYIRRYNLIKKHCICIPDPKLDSSTPETFQRTFKVMKLNPNCPVHEEVKRIQMKESFIKEHNL